MTEKQAVNEEEIVVDTTNIDKEVAEKIVLKPVTNIATAKKAKNVKQLTLADLKKESKKLDAQKEFELNIDGTDYVIKYDTIFRKTKQRAVLEDTLHFFREIGQNNMENIEMASAYTALLIVKHFTSLDVPDEIEDALAMLELLVDIDVLGEIVNELPEEEVLKIYELLTNTVDTLNSNLDMAEKEALEREAEIENEEIKELIQDSSVKEDVTE